MPNLYQKLNEIRKAVGSLSKDTEGHGYTYVSGSQILGKVKDKMIELNVWFVPSSNAPQHRVQPYVTSSGQEKIDQLVFGDMTYLLVDGDNPEDKLIIPWSFFGQQNDVSKAYGSALTYSERYLWLKLLGLPTDEDDPDSMDTTGKQSQYEMAKKIFKSSGSKSTGVISDPQAKRFWALAGGDKEIVDTVLATKALNSATEILRSDYDELCNQAQEMYRQKKGS